MVVIGGHGRRCCLHAGLEVGDVAEAPGLLQALQLVEQLVAGVRVLGVLQNGLNQLPVEQVQELLEQHPGVGPTTEPRQSSE